MGRRAFDMFDYQNLLHWWQQGHPLEAIRKGLGLDPKTSRKYIKLAQEVGISRDVPLSPEGLKPFLERVACLQAETAPDTPSRDQLVPYRHLIGLLLGLEGPGEGEEPVQTLKMKTAWRKLRREKGVTTSYPVFCRFVKEVFPGARRNVTIAMPESSPGDEAQVDFGFMGTMIDGRSGLRRRVWAFIMTLCHSRHMFVRFVTCQDQATWIRCHVEAFEFFGGVVNRVLLDNLKSGVIKPDIYDATLNRAYAECERHYKFVADPCRSGHAKDKAKVERAVPYVRDALVRGYELKEVQSANETARQWCRGEAGTRDHGTTGRHPIQVFQEREQPMLKPLPVDRFEIPTWKLAKVHPNHHLVFEAGYYSVPTRYVGDELWVRGTFLSVQIFDQGGTLIWTWERTTKEDRWRTELNHYPPGKREFLIQGPDYCKRKADVLGTHISDFIKEVLIKQSRASLRKAQAILRLAERFGAERLDRACARALQFGATDCEAVRTILMNGLDLAVPPPAEAEPIPANETDYAFLRPADSFVHESAPSLGGER